MGASGPLDNEHESVAGNVVPPKKAKTITKRVDPYSDEIVNPKYLTANADFI